MLGSQTSGQAPMMIARLVLISKDPVRVSHLRLR